MCIFLLSPIKIVHTQQLSIQIINTNTFFQKQPWSWSKHVAKWLKNQVAKKLNIKNYATTNFASRGLRQEVVTGSSFGTACKNAVDVTQSKCGQNNKKCIV